VGWIYLPADRDQLATYAVVHLAQKIGRSLTSVSEHAPNSSETRPVVEEETP
jgi:hypothetical protein